MAVKARQAMLNSDPSLTYTSETSASEAVPRDQDVSVSRSCLVATSRCVTDFSMVDNCREQINQLLSLRLAASDSRLAEVRRCGQLEAGGCFRKRVSKGKGEVSSEET
jgi:hypothetical protein